MRCFCSSPFLYRGEQCRLLPHRKAYEWNFRAVRNASILSPHEASAMSDGRTRLSQLWAPTGGIAASTDEDSQAKLVRAGFLRQAHSGIFHMLPLGRRVQEKLEVLIDKHMYQLGASKVSLSSISSEELWSKSGRLANVGSELFQFKDRKEANYLLSPTHEEEITTLVSSTVKSYKELPIRLYQISRKYRDERRPRHGLLRSREFIMKDLYTFDYSSTLALETYHQVRAAYARLFDELKLPYLVAEADSGDIGGDLSHEFHFPTSKGEDNVISCSSCDYVTNEELAESPVPKAKAETEETEEASSKVELWRGISKDRLTLINVWYASSPAYGNLTFGDSTTPGVNPRAVKDVFPELDPSVDDPLSAWTKVSVLPPGEAIVPQRLINFLDHSLSRSDKVSIRSTDSHLKLYPASVNDAFKSTEVKVMFEDSSNSGPLNLLRIKDGDICPRCSGGSLRIQRAIELGHTFHLGTRYSEPLAANVKVPAEVVLEMESAEDLAKANSRSSSEVPMQMGCHGIGVSRMIGAVADTLADEKGLNWPRVMAPFEVVIVAGKGLDQAALDVYDTLRKSELDIILDDRSASFPWKMQDADLIGYPIIVVVGRRWKSEKKCEIQCRRLGIRQQVPIGELTAILTSLLEQL